MNIKCFLEGMGVMLLFFGGVLGFFLGMFRLLEDAFNEDRAYAKVILSLLALGVFLFFSYFTGKVLCS